MSKIKSILILTILCVLVIIDQTESHDLHDAIHVFIPNFLKPKSLTKSIFKAPHAVAHHIAGKVIGLVKPSYGGFLNHKWKPGIPDPNLNKIAIPFPVPEFKKFPIKLPVFEIEKAPVVIPKPELNKIPIEIPVPEIEKAVFVIPKPELEEIPIEIPVPEIEKAPFIIPKPELKEIPFEIPVPEIEKAPFVIPKPELNKIPIEIPVPEIEKLPVEIPFAKAEKFGVEVPEIIKTPYFYPKSDPLNNPITVPVPEFEKVPVGFPLSEIEKIPVAVQVPQLNKVSVEIPVLDAQKVPITIPEFHNVPVDVPIPELKKVPVEIQVPEIKKEHIEIPVPEIQKETIVVAPKITYESHGYKTTEIKPGSISQVWYEIPNTLQYEHHTDHELPQKVEGWTEQSNAKAYTTPTKYDYPVAHTKHQIIEEQPDAAKYVWHERLHGSAEHADVDKSEHEVPIIHTKYQTVQKTPDALTYTWNEQVHDNGYNLPSRNPYSTGQKITEIHPAKYYSIDYPSVPISNEIDAYSGVPYVYNLPIAHGAEPDVTDDLLSQSAVQSSIFKAPIFYNTDTQPVLLDQINDGVEISGSKEPLVSDIQIGSNGYDDQRSLYRFDQSVGVIHEPQIVHEPPTFRTKGRELQKR